ncbi:unnamed protein product [Caenorhabditis brenneri]
MVGVATPMSTALRSLPTQMVAAEDRPGPEIQRHHPASSSRLDQEFLLCSNTNLVGAVLAKDKTMSLPPGRQKKEESWHQPILAKRHG